ncbi:hypothetical protein NPM18_24700 [Bacillus cereus]|uniref:Uncharacterized protein n=2 Tax=Bacillus cereus TaxID=1396 RepID=A0AAW5L8E3_BACCE|nr:hypothetical protein [Bacillus cereus]MCQ6288979.1 hypothetical protein [Bacillus cereus]MCQ6318393.1 hypothetical protein [Bacillus cereus]MCQ6330203.1 hypothetical protein [Bacillus cereus]MCQ6386007.1 hypothetical protein [Bacillus cereus]
MFLKQFREVLMQGAIPIGIADQCGIALRQFDEIQYNQHTYLIIWHPMYDEFVGSHESGDWIPYAKLHQTKFIKNLKDSFTCQHIKNP